MLLAHIGAHNTYVVLIPANCTDRLQPLNISTNKPAKDFFQEWYKICRQFQGMDPKEPDWNHWERSG